MEAGQLPTGSEGRQLVLGYRFAGSWDDPVGGPFSTTLRLSLSAGIDLVPAYVWPQPYIVGEGPLCITYWSGEQGPSQSFTTRLFVRDAQGELVTETTSRATVRTWSSIEWSGHTKDGHSVSAGSYSFTIFNEEGTLLAQGVLRVAESAPTDLRGEVSGEVWAADQALPGATVSLLTGSGRLVDSCVTDGDGSFLFQDLAPGTYFLKASCPGYLAWSGKQFFLDEKRPSHRERITLEANNALFVVASVQRLNSSLVSVSQHHTTLMPGDAVRISGYVYNSGTRPVRDIAVEAHWPACLHPLSDHGDGITRLQIPELAPGQSVSISFAGVCGFASASDDTPGFIVLTARAWAEREDGAVEMVESPPRFLRVAIEGDGSASGGLLACFVFWDSDGDGRYSSQDAPAAGVRLRVGRGSAAGTNKDGWLIRRVPRGPVGVYHLRDGGFGHEHPVLATTVYPGEVLVYCLVLSPDGSLRVVDDGRAAQATISWSIRGGKPSWQGAGGISVARQDWSWSWSLPARMEVVRHGDDDRGLSEHRLAVDASDSQPSLVSSHTLHGRPVTEGRRDSISLSAAVGRQTAVRCREWPAAGTGPYDIGMPVQSVHEVSIRNGTQRVVLGEAEYSWSPSGHVWLVRPAQLFVDYRQEGPLLVAAEYVPADAPGVPTLGIAIRARPRSEGPGSELIEEFGVNWALSDLTAKEQQPVWRVTWERRLPDSRFLWEGGTVPSPGADPSEGSVGPVVSPQRGSVSTETLSVWPPYGRIEQRVQKGVWWLNAVHERRNLLRMQGVTLGRGFSWFGEGNLGLRFARWAGPDTVDGGRASLDVELGQHKSVWQWRLSHSLTLVETGSAPSEHEDWIGRYDSEKASLSLSYVPSSGSGPRVGLHMDTRSGKTWAELDHFVRLGTAVEAGVGGTAHRGGVTPRARLKWGLVDIGARALASEYESGCYIDVTGEGHDWSVTWSGIYSSTRRAQELRFHHTEVLAQGGLFHIRVRNKASSPRAFCCGRLMPPGTAKLWFWGCHGRPVGS